MKTWQTLNKATEENLERIKFQFRHRKIHVTAQITTLSKRWNCAAEAEATSERKRLLRTASAIRRESEDFLTIAMAASIDLSRTDLDPAMNPELDMDNEKHPNTD